MGYQGSLISVTGERVMRKQQQGMTTIGMIILVAFIGIFGYGILQMVPVYLESMRIQQVLNQTKENLDGQKATVAEIRSSLSKGLTTNSLYDLSSRKDFEVKRLADGYEVIAEYERERDFVANVYLLAKFNHSVQINR
ncbi:MAG: DUF4845 domain-containing protein [Gammaproteobacteria bacterium]|nr:DUF4845 domain-containing protein [Gammaproteobacteria bacterium]